jgi:hypothetical protein
MSEKAAIEAHALPNQHVVGGLGGGNMNTSNGGRFGNVQNNEFFKKLAAAKRATAAAAHRRREQRITFFVKFAVSSVPSVSAR